ncbi:MAG: CRISPR-associated endoribonuclease Cas6 [Bacillota bacterium]|nr:CRISPR-associated endoribonuclease Cas6 [Bacillota bacterium]
MSFIKHSIDEYHPEAFADYFDKTKCVSKSYSFAVAFPRETKFQGNTIMLRESHCSMTFSSANLYDITMFYNAFMKQMNRPYPIGPDNYLILHELSFENVMPILKDTVTVQMLSPLCLRQHDRATNRDQYITWEDENFEQAAAEHMIAQLKAMGRHPSEIQFTAVQGKKTIVSEFGITFAVSIGTYRIQADPETLNLLQYAGIGSRRNAGFGLFRVIQ